MEKRRRIRGVFTDIDDTLTDGGRIEAATLDALFRLQRAGFLVVPITGRPAGWCDMIARTWPVDAVIGENGAFYFRYDQSSRRMVRQFVDDPVNRADKRRRLDEIADAVLAAVPGSALAADQAYRETDLAIDFAEDVGPLSDDDINNIVDIFLQHGATAKVSSIHVNGWFGSYDKLTMARTLMQEMFATDLTTKNNRYVFVGDSPNDAPMFGFFENSVGVANVKPFTDRCDALPHWITTAPRGAGFCELAEALLSVR
jgi:HAD superfamily hydrolase (TIGR01484 family)